MWYTEYIEQFRFLIYLALGFVAGSFLNVCIYRIPRGISLFHPPSFCPACKNQIPWHDNIPIFSFFYLRGKCRFCGGKISWRYPMVEALSIAIFLSVHLTQPLTHPQKIYYILFLCLLLLLFFIDLEHGIIPDAVSYPGIGIGLVGRFLFFPWYSSVLNGFAGGAILGGLIAVVRWVGGKVFGREAMGVGDVYMGILMGMFLGWKLALVAFFLSFFFGGLYGIPLLLSQWVKVKYRPFQEVKFGPFLALAGVVSYFYGEYLLMWYGKYLGLG